MSVCCICVTGPMSSIRDVTTENSLSSLQSISLTSLKDAAPYGYWGGQKEMGDKKILSVPDQVEVSD
jgi:hypothetical protein